MKDIQDDEIRIIGHNKKNNLKTVIIIVAIAAVLAIVLCLFFLLTDKNTTKEFQQNSEISQTIDTQATNEQKPAFIEVRDTTINDVPLKIYIPHNAITTLQMSNFDTNDADIIMCAQATYVRADNGGIVGDFVFQGQELAKGKSMSGFCAIIGDEITIGSSLDTTYYNKAVKNKAHFFRQISLVCNGKPQVVAQQKGKSIRRTLAWYQNQIVVIQTVTKESYHDFIQALVDIGVEEAINLIGSQYSGFFYKGENKNKITIISKPNNKSKNNSFLVWKKCQKTT